MKEQIKDKEYFKSYVMITLGDLLKERGMSIYELAKRTALNYGSLHKFIANKNDLYDRDKIACICRVLNCTPGDLSNTQSRMT